MLATTAAAATALRPTPTRQSEERLIRKAIDVGAALEGPTAQKVATVQQFAETVRTILGPVVDAGLTKEGLKLAVLEANPVGVSAGNIDALMNLVTSTKDASKTFTAASLEKFNVKIEQHITLIGNDATEAPATRPLPINTSDTHAVHELLVSVSRLIQNAGALESKMETGGGVGGGSSHPLVSDAESLVSTQLKPFVESLNSKFDSSADVYNHLDVEKVGKALIRVATHLSGATLSPEKLEKLLGVLVAVKTAASE